MSCNGIDLFFQMRNNLLLRIIKQIIFLKIFIKLHPHTNPEKWF
jgi:hypothetical protein